MKKSISYILLLSAFFAPFGVNAADLLDVYQKALSSDPIFQQALAQRLSTKEGVPITLATLLPNIDVTMVPSITRQGFSGSLYQSTTGTSANFLSPRNNTQRAYNLTLTATQTIFDVAQFSSLAGALATSKGADATLNAALQDLMIRVANAYFNVLKDEDNLSYTEATKRAYAKQLDQSKQQYDVGLKTLTDVYTAQASYDSARAGYIAAQTILANDRENLRVITGVYYSHLAPLSESFPLISPRPVDVDKWVDTAVAQNWNIKAARYAVQTAKQMIHQQFAGHLPTLNVQGTLNRAYADNINRYNTFNTRNGPGTQVDRSIQLNLTVPVFAGGGVVAQTNQAVYDFQVTQQQLEQTVRNTVNLTRQSYLNVVSGITQIAADKQTIKSTISSLNGMEASYRVGTQTLVDVLNQQQKVFQAQTQYATDRYAFVNNILLLKQSAGTLSFDDLRAVNVWLIEKKDQRRSAKKS